MQALDPAALRFLGRAHGRDEAIAAIRLARDTFARYSFDLIYARPGQSLAAWQAELDEALRLAGEHLSLYQLTIEPGTAFGNRAARGETLAADEETATALFEATQEQLGKVLDAILESAGIGELAPETREKAIKAAKGLTTVEAENAFALSVVECGVLRPAIVAREKANEVKKGGLLEVHSSIPTLDEIGGLEQLKAWLVQRRDAFGKEAQQYGLPSPKGLLIVGIPGTGKSLTAKATASVFNRPLLKLDAGQLFGSLVGSSEANTRSVIATAEAIAPCVLWVDELEKGFSGAKSSGVSDGGTASRVLGTFLSWLQDRAAPVFVVATANDVTQLPAELLRKGRFDELFFVDLPNHEEREAIWRIQMRKFGRTPDKYDVATLAKATEGLTGSEIEQLFIDALHEAFSRRDEPSDLSIAVVLSELVPLSKLMSEQIEALRKWAKGRARLATKPGAQSTQRKIVAGGG